MPEVGISEDGTRGDSSPLTACRFKKRLPLLARFHVHKPLLYRSVAPDGMHTSSLSAGLPPTRGGRVPTAARMADWQAWLARRLLQEEGVSGGKFRPSPSIQCLQVFRRQRQGKVVAFAAPTGGQFRVDGFLLEIRQDPWCVVRSRRMNGVRKEAGNITDLHPLRAG